MAKLSIDVSVSVDRGINVAIKDLLQAVADNYGVMVREVNVNWVDTSHIGDRSALINEVRIDSSRRY